MKYDQTGKTGRRFMGEQLLNTLVLLFIIILPIVVVTLFSKWVFMITISCICMVIFAISSLLDEGYSFLKSKF